MNAPSEQSNPRTASADLASTPNDDIVLTGDRPTGPLHLGHYAGSLKSRINLQGKVPQTILIADLQALTDNSGRPAHVARHVEEVVLDYLACGIDPKQSTIVLQSAVPELAELTMLYMNLVTVARLERNPTLRSEIAARGFARDIPAGFLVYPVSQAADITAFRGTLIPVGEDQLPMLEQCNEIVRKITNLAKRPVLKECRPLLSNTPRLPGTDGRKASKSFGNAIPLSSSSQEIESLVRSMYTDPGHILASDPGVVEGNVVFEYLDAFDPDREKKEELKEHYRRGGLGDSVVKKHCNQVLQDLVGPIRERRSEYALHMDYVRQVVAEGTQTARHTAAEVLSDVRSIFMLNRQGGV